MARYADGYENPALRLPDKEILGWKVSSLVDSRLETRCDRLVVVNWASNIPRRLGGDSNGAELAADRKALRQLGYLYTRSVERWSSIDNRTPELPELDEVSPDQRKAGAQLQLVKFIADAIVASTAESESDCTVAIQANLRRVANKLAAVHEWEMSELRRILARYEKAPR